MFSAFVLTFFILTFFFSFHIYPQKIAVCILKAFELRG